MHQYNFRVALISQIVSTRELYKDDGAKGFFTVIVFSCTIVIALLQFLCGGTST